MPVLLEQKIIQLDNPNITGLYEEICEALEEEPLDPGMLGKLAARAIAAQETDNTAVKRVSEDMYWQVEYELLALTVTSRSVSVD